MQNFIQNLEQYWQKFINHLPLYFFALILFLIFWLTTRIEKRIVKRLINKLEDKSKVEAILLLDRILRISIVIIGIILALAVAGVNLTALLTGAGIFGFIFGFALKDLISNFFAGLILLWQKPIKIGDYIEIDKKTGKVIAVETRHTILLQENREKIIIPNSDFLTKMVIKKEIKKEG